jgi:hypothetical protein
VKGGLQSWLQQVEAQRTADAWSEPNRGWDPPAAQFSTCQALLSLPQITLAVVDIISGSASARAVSGETTLLDASFGQQAGILAIVTLFSKCCCSPLRTPRLYSHGN